MNANIWIGLGILALAFSAYAIPHGFNLKKTQEKSMSTKIKIKDATVFGDVVGRDKISTYNQQKYVVSGEPDEVGTWSPSIQYLRANVTKDYDQKILVDEAEYTLQGESVRVSFDMSVNLKQVPSGSTLAIGGLPLVVVNKNVNNFKVYQSGLNHSPELMITAMRNPTQFGLVTQNSERSRGDYVTDGSEDSVRIWGYIEYGRDPPLK